MAWFSGKVSLGNFPDLAGAVNKISESVKNIEKNFDSALGFEERPSAAAANDDSSPTEASGLWPSSADKKALFDPVMSFIGRKGEDETPELLEKPESSTLRSLAEEQQGVENDASVNSTNEQTSIAGHADVTTNIHLHKDPPEGTNIEVPEEEIATSAPHNEAEADLQVEPHEISEPSEHVEKSASSGHIGDMESSETDTLQNSVPNEPIPVISVNPVEEDSSLDESNDAGDLHRSTYAPAMQQMQHEAAEVVSPAEVEDVSNDNQGCSGTEHHSSQISASDDIGVALEGLENIVKHSDDTPETVPEIVSHEDDEVSSPLAMNIIPSDHEKGTKEKHLSSGSNSFDSADLTAELEKLKKEMKMMETALQGAARQAQAKADEIAKMMNENEQLKAVIEDLRRKSTEAEVESLREEYHQRVSALERKVYALTKERDTLRREQSKKSDAAALLKEKDEIINQVMAEGEELSKKQAAQESQIRKLRAQIRDLEEEKKGMITKLQVEENKVESIKRDKAATEKLLQETIEKHQAELATQKEYYTNALSAAKEAEALAEARANNEARTELEIRLREAEEREAMLVQALEELRQTLNRNEQQAAFREDMLRRDIEDFQKRYQASERRCEELITQVPESTRPLLRQIEAMQETTARRAEAWAAVERTLNSRLQEAEGKAAAAEERERSVNERLSQTLSRINVLEAQISCLRTEQTQLSKSLEKERQRAAENRQEYLALKEEADTHEGHVRQLEEEIRELKRKHKQELQEALTYRELLQQDMEREKASRLELERTVRLQSSAASDQSPRTKLKPGFENGSLSRKLSSASSLGSMEESFYLQASLDSSDSFSERRNPGEAMGPYYIKSMTPSSFEAALRQKEGELASYMSRLASMESIRDSLAEELVKLTEECDKLRAEASMLPGIRAELEALRRRHSAALELMGERDEELEELRADIVDLKEMYREQVNLLVNKIQVMSPSIVAA